VANILDLVALMEGCSLRDAALRLQDWSGTMPPRSPLQSEETSRPAPNAPLHFALQHIDRHHPYLAQRGLSVETIRTFGVGCYRGNGFLRGRIVIPIHDERGELIAYVGRAIDGQEPKYRFPAGFRKSLVLFNLHRACRMGRPEVIVVEGFFDTFAVHQAGYRTVVALMGSTLSSYQADLLSAHFDRVILMLDGDEAGRQGTAMIAQKLASRISITEVAVEESLQPDQLEIDRMRSIIGSHSEDFTAADSRNRPPGGLVQ
jgi:DNA primase